VPRPAGEILQAGFTLTPSQEGSCILGLPVDGKVDEALKVGQAGIAAAAAPPPKHLAFGAEAEDAARAIAAPKRALALGLGRRAA